ncbi:branched-chain amino acid transport system permease protein [Bradyrhizobium sp. i1.3.1]
MMLLGVAMERVIIRHFYHRPHEDQLLVTFGLGICFVELVRLIFSSQSQLVPPPALFQGITNLGFMFYPTYRLAVVGIVAVALGALFIVLYRTRLGMIVRAGIEDSVMVDSLGINVYRVFMVVFGIGAMAAGFAGIVNAPVVSLTPGIGDDILVQDLRGGGDRRRRLVSGRDPRRPDRRRDHQRHLHVQPRLRLCDAVCGDDARARGATAWPARRPGPRVSDFLMLKQRPFLIETLTAIGLIAAPFVLPHLGFAPNTVNRILVWGLFGLGFDILFGFTGLLSFGQSAFYGTGGFVAAYLLTRAGFGNVLGALIIGMIAAAATGYLIGLIALRRTGIYFAMITVAIAEVFFFVEFNPLSDFTGGENGLPGVPTPSFNLGFTTIHFTNGWSLYQFIALCYFIGVIIALRIVRSPVGAIFSAIRDNPLRATAVGHNIHGYKLTAFVIAAAYAGFAGGLLGVLQAFMPPDAFTFDTSGQLVMQTAIGGRGTLFGPLVGATVWLFLQDFLQSALGLGAAWKLVLGVVFVVLVCFLRGGIVGGLVDLYGLVSGKRARKAAETEVEAEIETPQQAPPAPMQAREVAHPAYSGPILKATGLTKRYGGLVANSDIDFSVNQGELRGIIGPNGAGKSTFFKMLTCEIAPTSGRIVFEGRDITGLKVTEVCQLGLTKSYQVNQLFTGLTVRQNLTIAALAELRGKFRLDLFRKLSGVKGLTEQVEHTLALVNLTRRADTPVSELAYGEKRRLEIGLALATSPRLLLLDEPLAGMSPRERVETVKLLKSIARGRTMIIIDHDMDSLFELVERVTVLQEGKVLLDGTPEEIRTNAAVQEAYLGGVHGEIAA